MVRTDEPEFYLPVGCACFGILLASCIMIACSVSILDPHQMGLHYDGVSLRLENKTYMAGRYFLGLGHSFIKYPRQLQYIEFSWLDGADRDLPAHVWSRDGQEIVVEFGLYFRILPEHLSDLYYQFGTEYTHVVEDIATDAVRDVATEFDTIQFFSNRQKINDLISRTLNDRLRKMVFCEVVHFNLLALDIPDRFEAAVLSKVITEQSTITLGFKQQSAVISEGVSVINADAARRIAIIQAEAHAKGTVQVQNAQASAFKKLQTALATARKQLAHELGFDDIPDYRHLLQYMWTTMVAGASNNKLVFNADSALFTL